MTQDPAFRDLTQEVEAAKTALLRLAESEPEREWRAYELKTAARNGWTAPAMAIALEALVEEGQLQGDALALRFTAMAASA